MFKALMYFIAGAICMVAGWEAKRYYIANRPRMVKSLQAAKAAWLEKA